MREKNRIDKMLFIAFLLSCLFANSVYGDFDDCTFEEDECGWFSGSSVGVGSWRRVTTQELEDEGMDVHPSKDGAGAKTGNSLVILFSICILIYLLGHYMFAHYTEKLNIYSLCIIFT